MVQARRADFPILDEQEPELSFKADALRPELLGSSPKNSKSGSRKSNDSKECVLRIESSPTCRNASAIRICAARLFSATTG